MKTLSQHINEAFINESSLSQVADQRISWLLNKFRNDKKINANSYVHRITGEIIIEMGSGNVTKKLCDPITNILTSLGVDAKDISFVEVSEMRRQNNHSSFSKYWRVKINKGVNKGKENAKDERILDEIEATQENNKISIIDKATKLHYQLRRALSNVNGNLYTSKLDATSSIELGSGNVKNNTITTIKQLTRDIDDNLEIMGTTSIKNAKRFKYDYLFSEVGKGIDEY